MAFFDKYRFEWKKMLGVRKWDSKNTKQKKPNKPKHETHYGFVEKWIKNDSEYNKENGILKPLLDPCIKNFKV